MEYESGGRMGVLGRGRSLGDCETATILVVLKGSLTGVSGRGASLGDTACTNCRVESASGERVGVLSCRGSCADCWLARGVVDVEKASDAEGGNESSGNDGV